MEKAVEYLEAMFQKADSDIDKLTQRLNFEFENNEEVQVNPVDLLKKLDGVKKEYLSLAAQHAEIQTTAQAAVKEFQGHLNDVLQLLVTLQSAGGAQLTERPPELDRLEEMLGAKLPWGDGTEMPSSSAAADAEETSSTEPVDQSLQCNTPDRQPDRSTDTEIEAASSLFEMSPASVRQNCEEFVEITESEFNTVSELIRGRVKLSDVNNTYRIIWNHFNTGNGSKKNKKSEVLTPADMHKLGMKVAGSTGQAKLKVLRALKLLRMNTKGEVALL